MKPAVIGAGGLLDIERSDGAGHTHGLTIMMWFILSGFWVFFVLVT